MKYFSDAVADLSQEELKRNEDKLEQKSRNIVKKALTTALMYDMVNNGFNVVAVEKGMAIAIPTVVGEVPVTIEVTVKGFDFDVAKECALFTEKMKEKEEAAIERNKKRQAKLEVSEAKKAAKRAERAERAARRAQNEELK